MKIKTYTLRLTSLLFFFLVSLSVFSQNIEDDSFNALFPGPIPGPLPTGAFLYVPNQVGSASLKAKSDFQISFNHKINESSDWNFDIKNVNLSYSPIPHLYATVNWLQVENDEDIRFFDSKMTQGGFGIGGYYFKEVGDIFKKKNIFNKTKNWMMPQKGILVNGLLGYSRGKITHQLTYDVGHGKFALNKFYGQIGFDYQARIWGLAGSAKVGILNYGTTYLVARAPRDLVDPIEILKEKNNFKFRELELRAYLGIRYGQVYWSMVHAKTEEDLTDFVLPNYKSVGVLLEFQEFFKKKNKE